jgi:FKBP-type peptidyl-prolyl cis-trans isomerase
VVTKEEYDRRMSEEAKYAKENQEKDIQKYIAEHKLQMTKTASGIYYQFVLKGFSRRPVKGDSVTLHYTGYYLDGRVFDSSLQRDQPYTFKIGTDAILQGWNEALQLMSIRDKLLVIIPYQLAYGEKGGSGIPPFTPLVFELELLGIK